MEIKVLEEATWWKGIVAIAGGLSSFLFGNWSQVLTVLFILMIVDYLTGMMAGYVTKELSSKVGFKGILRKVGMVIVVGVGHGMDIALGTMGWGTENLIRDGGIFFYLANESLSILENLGRAKVPIPEPLRKAIVLLEEKKG